MSELWQRDVDFVNAIALPQSEESGSMLRSVVTTMMPSFVERGVRPDETHCANK